MKFGYMIFYVADVSATISFYESAFGLNRRFVTEDNKYGELDTGTTTLSFSSFEMADMNGVKVTRSKNHESSAEIGFVTENVERDFERALKAGATLVKKPTQKPWGQKVGFVKDLNGFLVEICSPVQ